MDSTTFELLYSNHSRLYLLQGIWYYGSDVSMLFLGMYILKRRTSLEDSHQ